MLQTADVDARIAAEAASLPACGSLSCFAAVAAMALAAVDATVAADLETTAVCGLSSCFAAAVAMVLVVAAAAVDAAITVAITADADANLNTVRP